MPDAHPYAALTPDEVLNAVESLGFQSDARIYPLNSYENRVYRVGLDGGDSVIVKFYRPGRWSDAQILEEHAFVNALADLEIPVVAPMDFAGRGTLCDWQPFRFSVFPNRPGRAPELDDLDNLIVLGRFVGRIHALGARREFKHRPTLSVERFASQSRETLLSGDFLPADLRPAYETLSAQLVSRLEVSFNQQSNPVSLCLHGDCHPGNVLWQQQSPYFVDFDDCLTGPAIQDLWMMLSGPRDRRQAQLRELVEGYEEFHTFRPAELALVEPLRTLRLMHYSAWLARRWQDPAFPHSFPWFNTPRYWAEHILELREQFSALDEPPLQLF